MQYYIVDVETTGLKAGWHEVVEISIIRCDDTREQLTEQIKAEYPERASAVALEITGKTIPDLLQGQDREDVVLFANEWFARDGLTPEHRCMVAHKAMFDKKFCHALWNEVGEVFPAVCWLDTVEFTKMWSKKIGVLPETKTKTGKPSYTLASSLKFAKIKAMPGMHDAGSDARNTYLLWKKGMETGIVDHLPLIKRWEHKLSND